MSILQLHKNEVEVLAKNGIDISKQAWMISRPNVTAEEMEDPVKVREVLSLDIPVNELNHYVVRIFCPIMIREILFTPRDHVAWARTSRVDNITDFWMISEYTSPDLFHSIESNHAKMIEMMNSGVHQDTYRSALPMAYMTEFVTTLSFRHLCMWINTFDIYAKKYPHLQELFWHMRFLFIKVLKDDIGCSELSVEGIVKNYKPWSFDQLKDEEKTEFDGTVSRFLVVRRETTVGLRAQAVRQRTLSPVDNFNEVFLEPLHGMALSQSSKMFLELSASIDVWKKVVSKRNCWLAQTDIWKPFVDGANVHLTNSDAAIDVPCDKGFCPYKGDADKRVEGKDPGPICPRHAHLHLEGEQLKIAQDQSTRILDYADTYQKPLTYWTGEIRKMNQKPTTVNIVQGN